MTHPQQKLLEVMVKEAFDCFKRGDHEDGKALLYLSLKSMKEMGYAYAIIGGVGPAKFYETTFGAKIIEGSDPGIYKGILSHVPV